uniref:Uncharacterized protein n=1 Tax=Cacopsylla melanoneura TaxID=428564 RepID=A0A8D8YYL8_9HEMI
MKTLTYPTYSKTNLFQEIIDLSIRIIDTRAATLRIGLEKIDYRVMRRKFDRLILEGRFIGPQGSIMCPLRVIRVRVLQGVGVRCIFESKARLPDLPSQQNRPNCPVRLPPPLPPP